METKKINTIDKGSVSTQILSDFKYSLETIKLNPTFQQMQKL